MATEIMKDRKKGDGDRPSGVPAPHQLGESRREGLYVVLALIVMAAIGLSFWFEATH